MFSGAFGAARTAALLVAFAKFESSFDPHALGDCSPGKPKTVQNCQSLGMWQISKAHAPADELLEPETAVVHARKLLAQSAKICSGRPPEERYAWYAAGGDGCKESGFTASKHRFWLARKIFNDHPYSEE